MAPRTTAPARVGLRRGYGRAMASPLTTLLPGTRALLAVAVSTSLLIGPGALAVDASSRPLDGVAEPSSAFINDAPLIQRGKMALGVSMPRSRDLSQLDAFSASIGGNKPAMWSIWSQWGSAKTQEFPTAVMNGLRDRRVVPFIFWEPVDPDRLMDPAFAYERISAGDHDAYIRRFARDAKSFGGLVLLRFAGEANGAYFPWGMGGPLANTAKSYKQAWRHIWSIFDARGADNVRFVWSMVKQRCPGGCNPYTAFYPGSRYVDYMAFSSYNWGAISDKAWAGMYKGYRRVVKHLASISRKPILAAETGTNHVGGDKAVWIRKGYRKVYNELPRVMAVMYLNYDVGFLGHPDWSMSSSGGGLGAYEKIARLSGFKGKLTLKGS